MSFDRFLLFSGDGWPSTAMQGAFQTKYWPSTGSSQLYTDWARIEQPQPGTLGGDWDRSSTMTLCSDSYTLINMSIFAGLIVITYVE